MGTFKTRDGTEIFFKDWGEGDHGIAVTHRDQFNADLLAFIRS